MKNILIYGIGNPYRCDDTVGLNIAEYFKGKINQPNITVKSGSIDGLAILEEMHNYEKVIFVDSIKTKDGTPGDIYRIPINPDQDNISPSISHGINFITALKMADKFGYKLPEDIVIYAMEIKDNTTFAEECTPQIKKKIPELIQKIKEEIGL